MKQDKLNNLFDFLPKSKVKAGEGLDEGKYPFYTSSENQSKFMDEFQYEPGCLVFGTGGKANVHFTTSRFATSTDCITIRPSPKTKIDAGYVFQFFKGNMQVLERGFKGAGLKHISKSYLSDIQIQHPEEIGDQKRIAHLLGKVEGLITRRKQHLQQLDDLLKSVFHKMFGDPARNEKGWELTTIGELATEVKYGTSASAQGGAYKYLRMNNITQEGYWNFDSLKYIDVPEKDFEKYSLRKGDLVFNRTNSKELVGKTAVYNRDESVVIAGYLIRVRFDEHTNPWFVWGHLNSSYGKTRLFNLCRNIVGMANINAKELQAIPILDPPIELQNQFAAIVENVEGLKSRYQRSLDGLESLYGVLSQKAFKGELDLSRVPLPIESTKEDTVSTEMMNCDFEVKRELEAVK